MLDPAFRLASFMVTFDKSKKAVLKREKRRRKKKKRKAAQEQEYVKICHILSSANVS